MLVFQAIIYGMVSDCEELVGHQIEHLGRNATNYFMYLWAGPVRPPSLFMFRQLLHLNQAGVQHLVGYLTDAHARTF